MFIFHAFSLKALASGQWQIAKAKSQQHAPKLGSGNCMIDSQLYRMRVGKSSRQKGGKQFENRFQSLVKQT
jgi:hypothetical protein